MSEAKSKLEIALMPIAVAVVGIVGSATISLVEMRNAQVLADAQAQASKEQARNDRQIQILQMFSEKITGEPKEQALALRILGSVDPELHGQIADAVASSTDDFGIEQLARQQEVQATQRLEAAQAIQTQPAIGQKPAPPLEQQPAPDRLCQSYWTGSRAEWRKAYLRSPVTGSWHVFVESLPANASQTDASNSADRFEKRFKALGFETMPTESPAREGNQRFAIVIASGLRDKEKALEIASFADKCIAPGAYPYLQKS